jgi:phage-related baseplate assembly protein
VNAVNLELLPPLTVVPQIDYEEIVADIVTKANLENASPVDPSFRVALAGAYRELLIRQEANEQAIALTLAYASGPQLDHIGVTYYRTPSGEPVVRLNGESDDDYKARLQESPEGMSVAGPEGAYRFHARSASELVAGVDVDSPTPCFIVLTVLSREGPAEGQTDYTGPLDGVASPGLLATVAAGVDPVRPLGDRVTYQSAEIVYYQIEAVIIVDRDLDPEMVLAEAQSRADEYVATAWRLGGLIVRSAVDAALTAPGVREVILPADWTDTRCARHQAPRCNGLLLILGGAV